MKKFSTLLMGLLMIVSMSYGQNFGLYGQQMLNGDFELWENEGLKEAEPNNWNSFMNSAGSLASFGKQGKVASSLDTRPGSFGGKSAKIWSSAVFGIKANGNLTTGRIFAANMSATHTDNRNQTIISEENFNQKITVVPDSLAVWTKFIAGDGSTTNQARVAVQIHGDTEFRDPTNGSDNNKFLVASAEKDYVSNGGIWQRHSVPFVKDTHSSPQYILASFTTNKTAGQGTKNDTIYIDDILLIYTPKLQVDAINEALFIAGGNFKVPFTLTGTMSPYNVDAAPNKVYLELSDANGSFTTPTRLGELTTNVSGEFNVTLPANINGSKYRIRVVTTNYPMVSKDNGKDLAFVSYNVKVEVAGDGGSVSEGGVFKSGESFKIIATPDEDYTFEKWTKDGESVSSHSEYSFTVSEDVTYLAHFRSKTLDIFKIQVQAMDGGKVEGDTVGLLYGKVHTVKAIPDEDFVFLKWTHLGEQVSVDMNYSFTVKEDVVLMAHFIARELETYQITVNVNDSTAGKVSGGGQYIENSEVTLKASPSNQDFIFLGWLVGEDTVSKEAIYTFIATKSESFTACFQARPLENYTITATSSNEIAGSVSGGGIFAEKSQIILKATANPNYHFVKWMMNDSVVSTNAEFEITVSEDKAYMAYFEMDVNNKFLKSNTKVSLYPNPSNEFVNIQGEGISQLEILNLQGMVLIHKIVMGKETQLNVSALSSGNYFVKVYLSNEVQVLKLLILK